MPQCTTTNWVVSIWYRDISGTLRIRKSFYSSLKTARFQLCLRIDQHSTNRFLFKKTFNFTGGFYENCYEVTHSYYSSMCQTTTSPESKVLPILVDFGKYFRLKCNFSVNLFFQYSIFFFYFPLLKIFLFLHISDFFLFFVVLVLSNLVIFGNGPSNTYLGK